MNQEAGFHLLGGAESKFLVGAVHGIAGLEGDDAAPSQAGEFGAKFRRSQAQRTEIIVGGRLSALDASAHIPWIRLVDRVIRAGMGFAGAVEYRLGFGLPVGLPDVLDMQHRQHYSFGIAQCDFAAARLQRLGELFADVKRDRHGPQHTAGQLHVVAYAFVVGAIHESAQGRKPAAQQQLKIAELARGQVPRRPLAGVGFQLVDGFRLGDKIDKFSTVGRDQMTTRSAQTFWPPGIFVRFQTSAIVRVFRQVRKSCHSDVGKGATVAPFPAAAPGIRGVRPPAQGPKPRVRQKGSPVPSHQWNPFFQFKTKTATSQSNHRENGGSKPSGRPP